MKNSLPIFKQLNICAGATFDDAIGGEKIPIITLRESENGRKKNTLAGPRVRARRQGIHYDDSPNGIIAHSRNLQFKKCLFVNGATISHCN